MKKQELFFWLLLSAIYNFAEHFGDEEIKELHKCMSHFSKKNEKDISTVLKWCFECYYSLICSDIDCHQIYEINCFQGMFSLMERFHYVHFTVKKTMKEEMESCWKEVCDEFNQPAYNAWSRITGCSLKTPKKLVNGWVKENNVRRMSGKY